MSPNTKLMILKAITNTAHYSDNTLWVYYCPELDELFALTKKPPRPCQWYKLCLGNAIVLDFVTCMGKL